MSSWLSVITGLIISVSQANRTGFNKDESISTEWEPKDNLVVLNQ